MQVDEKYEFLTTFKKKFTDISESVAGSAGDSEPNLSDVEFEGDGHKKYIRVDANQVGLIGFELRLSFMAKNVEMEEVLAKLFQDLGPKPLMRDGRYRDVEMTGIAEIQATLSQEPFCISDEQKLRLLSRYLIEENDEYLVKFDPNKKQHNKIIRSIFRKMVGEYETFDAEQDEMFYNYWSDNWACKPGNREII